MDIPNLRHQYFSFRRAGKMQVLIKLMGADIGNNSSIAFFIPEPVGPYCQSGFTNTIINPVRGLQEETRAFSRGAGGSGLAAQGRLIWKNWLAAEV